MTTRRPGLKAALLAATAVCIPMLAPAARAAASRPPNVIVILADDLGYGDTGVYGSSLIRTPNIDRLAASGVRFTAAYVTHPVCAPSRAGLLTGRYQERFGYEFNPAGKDATGGVSLKEITVAQVMKSAGYATGMIGKWHLGQSGPYYPTARGFDHFFGMAGGGSTYLIDPKPGDEIVQPGRSDVVVEPGGALSGSSGTAQDLKTRLEKARSRGAISRDGAVVRADGYLTDDFTRAAVDYIEANKGRPFFLYLAYNAPHVPLQATQKYLDRYRDVKDPGKRVYAAMVSALDDGVGAVEAELRRAGLAEDTLVLFLSDNGCPDYDLGACSNAPLRGFKRTHFEGGVRVPFIVSWPGHVPAGRLDGRQVSSLDILPTAAAVARAKLPADREYDGVDLIPYLTGRSRGVPNPVLFWRAGGTFAIRDGAWKMLLLNKAPPGAKPSMRWLPPAVAQAPPYDARYGRLALLYDLNDDVGERRNLAGAKPGVVTRLEAMLAKWSRKLVPAQWVSVKQFYQRYDDVVAHLYD